MAFSPSALGCPTNFIDLSFKPKFPTSTERYEEFKSHFEPALIDSENTACKTFRFSCWKENSNPYILTLIERKTKNQIIKQEFKVDWKKGPPLWIKSERTSKQPISNSQMKNLMELLSPAFKTKSSMGVPGLAGHFWLENASSKEVSVMDLYSERFEGEEKFLKAISKYVPYLPELPHAFYIQMKVISPSKDSL